MEQLPQIIKVYVNLPDKGLVELKVKATMKIGDAFKSLEKIGEGLNYIYNNGRTVLPLDVKMPFSIYGIKDGALIDAKRTEPSIHNYKIQMPTQTSTKCQKLYTEFLKHNDLVQSKNESKSYYTRFAKKILDKREQQPNKIIRKIETKYAKPEAPCSEELPKFW